MQRQAMRSLLCLLLAFASADDAEDRKSLAEDRDLAATTYGLGTNWEGMLTPIPVSVNLLGSMFYSAMSHNDFSLAANHHGAFKYLKYPLSYRMTVKQITDESWSAYDKAQTNMNRIQALMEGVPTEVTAALGIVSSGRPAVIKRLLPRVMTRVKTMAEQAAHIANDTHLVFEGLMSLVGETMQATVSAQSLETRLLDDARKELQAAKDLEQGLVEFRTQLRAEAKRAQDQYATYKAGYEKALSEKPHGFLAFLMKIVHFFCPPHDSYAVLMKSNCDFRKHPDALKDGSCVISADFLDVLKSMDLLFTELEEMQRVVTTRKGTTGSPSGDIEAIKTSLIPPTHTVDSTASNTLHRSEAAGYLQRAQAICGEAEGAFSQNKTNEDKLSQAEAELEGLLNSVKPLEAAYCFATKERKPAKVAHFHGNWRYKSEMYKQAMEDSERRSKQLHQEQLDASKQIKDELVKIAHLYDEIHTDQDTLEAMRTALSYLAKIRQQWSMLISFLMHLADRADITLGSSIMEFAGLADALSVIDHLTKDEIDDVGRLMRESLQPVDGTAYYLYTLSKTYVDVSERYVVDHMAHLRAMSSMSASDQKQLLSTLQAGCESAVDMITQKASETRAKAKRLIAEQIREVDLLFSQSGVPANPADLADIATGKAMVSV